MKNETINCTHKVPENKYGIFAMHCSDNVPFTDNEYNAILDGPVAAMETEYQKRLNEEIVRIRREANNWTPEYRQYLYEMGMKVVNGECKMPYIGSLP